ncbi:tetratricopeptide repeat protein [Paenibacillus aurantiacus]|uniref:Tetratricopeptide repeat protein n=1 Tax=Paenibacillus aurantiacus TaxID=1936118 RepID=A0ABV5KID9_9BACL
MDRTGIDKYIAVYKRAVLADPGNNEVTTALGMCYLKLGLYDYAQKFFGKAIEQMVDVSDVYFYGAISLLKGKRPFVATLPVIRRAEELLEAAASLNPTDGKIYYTHAVIKQDYYHKKFINTSPSSNELFQQAAQTVISDEDIDIIERYMSVRV